MSRESIFIVEDERIIAMDLQHRLERMGYRVCGSASDANAAILGIRDLKPDLVLMDIVLQGPIDGIEIALTIKNELRIPVIFLSAYTDNATIDRAKEAGPMGFILKPFKERELATVIEMALFKSRADNRIRENEQLFSAILKSTTDAILVVDQEKRIVFLNPEAQEILETTEEDARTKRVEDFFTLSEMESGEPFPLPTLSENRKVLKIRNLRLTNRNNNSYVVEMTLNHELSPENGAKGSQSDGSAGGTSILSFKDISRLHEMTDAIKYQSSHDTLTGLLNRNEIALRLNEAISSPGARAKPAEVLFIDIDHFRVVNDSCGTQAGDRLLQETAQRIRAFMGAQDYAARCSGDDFILVHFPDPDNPERLGSVARDTVDIAQGLIMETRKDLFRWNGKEYPISLSIAIVPLDGTFHTEHDVMIAGTQTVYNTHESGGNHYSVFSQGSTQIKARASISEWITRIHEALRENRFRLFYQPILPLEATNTQHKLEILIRMIGVDGEIIQPGEFIPIAEHYNLMPAIDRWVIRESFAAVARIQKANGPLAKSIFCINLSGSSLLDESIIGYIMENAEETGVSPECICLEVTETSAILNLGSASRFITMLKEQGFTFALDDFGSGFSSFNYLKNLPVDYLKIDGCFIRNMDRDEVDYTMVQAISSMCKVLGLKTIGEFAENDTIIGQLRTIGVDYAQGYGISKPVPLEEA
ncbi:MAG TPA: EAL domain-containing protein [Treponemataceae bacterium]|nr:EAL domain-containing protein [Treponemataceae bacterium]